MPPGLPYPPESTAESVSLTRPPHVTLPPGVVLIAGLALQTVSGSQPNPLVAPLLFVLPL